MQITLTNLGKRFNRQWIFRGIDFVLESGGAYAITGPNGSGKSTLLQVVAGALEKNEGTISYKPKGASQPLDPDLIYSTVSFAAPYLELIEELTLTELLAFHFSLKPMLHEYSIGSIIDFVGLETAKNKQIRLFSSGMKQRVKLAQAFFSDVPVLLLDEPTANFDVQGFDLYLRMIETLQNDRLIIIGSNDPKEFSFCKTHLDIMAYKPSTS